MNFLFYEGNLKIATKLHVQNWEMLNKRPSSSCRQWERCAEEQVGAPWAGLPFLHCEGHHLSARICHRGALAFFPQMCLFQSLVQLRLISPGFMWPLNRIKSISTCRENPLPKRVSAEKFYIRAHCQC